MTRASDIFLQTERAKGATSILHMPKDVKFEVAYTGGSEGWKNGIEKALASDDQDAYAKLMAKNILLNVHGLVDVENTVEGRTKLLKDYEGIDHSVMAHAREPSNFIDVNAIQDELGN